MNRTEVKTMNDLPELPFVKVLSYLSLEDRLKSRAVSKRWYMTINSLRVKSLCYSERPSGFILGKKRWISGAFARNFISSARFEWFFDTFGQSILSNLKHLRLCDLELKEENRAAFTQTLNSFGKLEKLDLIRFGFPISLSKREFELNLPMLNSLQLDQVYGIRKLTLNAPRLQKFQLVHSGLGLVLVHGESVERLLADQLKCTAVKHLKNLQFLYIGTDFFQQSEIDSTLLSDLNPLKELHLKHPANVNEIFEQKKRYGRTDLKIYLRGLLLNGPDDPAIKSFLDYDNKELFVHLAENPSRQADEIPLFGSLPYTAIERVAPELAIDLLSRFTDLVQIVLDGRVQDIERFLDVLKNFDNIVELRFSCDQPQDLFDRLPEHCAVQVLTIDCEPSDLAFLSRLNHLIVLYVRFSIDAELIRKSFEGLQFLSQFEFKRNNKDAAIRVADNSAWTCPKRFQMIDFEADYEWRDVPDLNAAIQFILDTRPQESGQLESPIGFEFDFM